MYKFYTTKISRKGYYKNIKNNKKAERQLVWVAEIAMHNCFSQTVWKFKWVTKLVDFLCEIRRKCKLCGSVIYKNKYFVSISWKEKTLCFENSKRFIPH